MSFTALVLAMSVDVTEGENSRECEFWCICSAWQHA